jgi:altronate hydrolase
MVFFHEMKLFLYNMNLTFIQINSLDTVAVAIVDLPAGKCLSMAGRELVLLQDIPAGHKFALKFIAKDEEIIKYGYPIGHSNCDIEAGCWVHEHNLTSNLSGVQEYDYKPVWVYPTGEKKDLFFHGYKRANGKTGIRNEIWIVPTVGCVNGVADELVRSFLQKHPDLNGIDAVVAMKHPHGCSQLGDDLQHTKQILKDIVLHPNAGGVLVLGLGCEFIVPEDFKDFLGDYDKERIRFLVTQDVSD